MEHLSISRAWEQARTVLARDGALIATVALALIALPSAIAEFVNPGSTAGAPRSASGIVTLIVVAVIGIIGQLAVLRLAMGPSVSVGEAIGHAARRAIPYIAAAILIILALFLLAIPFIVVLAATGVSFEAGAAPPPAAYVLFLLYAAAAIALAVKMLLALPVAAAEAAGPITILKRSWQLTTGQFWRLLGFVILFIIALIIAVVAVSVVTNVIVTVLLGQVEPMSVGALVVALVQALVSAAATAIFLVMLARIYLQLSGRDAEASVPSSGT